MSNNNFRISLGRMILMVTMLMIVVVGGTFAWLTFSSKQSALVLTIGNINNTQITLSPYQIKEEGMTPVNTYTSGVSSNVTVVNGERSNRVTLFYKINELDTNLINNGLVYTVENSSGQVLNFNGSVRTDGKKYTATFAELLDGEVNTPDEIVIFDGDAVKNSTTDYKVYLWVDSSIGNQNNIVDSTVNVELNGAIGSVKISGTNTYGETLVANITDFDQSITGEGAPDYTYQWYSNSTNSTSGGTKINGATSRSYTIGEGLVGKYIYVVVTVSRAGYDGRTYVDITDATDEAGDGDYSNSTATVKCRSITELIAASATKVYDGTPLTNNNCSATGLLSGHTINCTMTSGSTITNAGNVANVIQGFTIKKGDVDVTNNYCVNKKTDGKLTVTKDSCVCTISDGYTNPLIGPSHTPNGSLTYSCVSTSDDERHSDGERYVTSNNTNVLTVGTLTHLNGITTAPYSVVGSNTGTVKLTAGAREGNNYNACTVDTVDILVKTNQYTVNYYSGETPNGNYTLLGNSTHIYGSAADSNKLKTGTTLGIPNSTLTTNYGWTLAGWSRTQDSTTVDFADGALANITEVDGATINLYAVYTRTITLYSGKDSATTDGTRTQKWNRNTIDSIKSDTPVAISKWSSSGYRHDTTAGTQQYNVETVSANITPAYNVSNKLYAVYSRTLTFKSGINQATTDGTRTQYYNSVGTLGNVKSYTPVAINNSWTALGYRDDDTASAKEYDSGTTVDIAPTIDNGSDVLYAVYVRTITVYNELGKDPSILTQNYNSANKITSATLPSITDISNWTTLGYRDDTTTSAKEYDEDYTPVVGDTATKYYAVYSRTLTISYNGNGATSGSVAGTTKVIYLNANSTTTSSQEVTLAANEFNKTGYTFNNWSDGSKTYAAGAKYNPNLAYNATSFSVTMYAQWDANTYNINYELNSGTAGTNKPTSVAYDSTVTISNPTKTATITGNANGTGATIGNATSGNFTFNGWTSSTIDTSTAKYNSSSWTSWNGTTKVTSTTFKNLTPTNGATVTMIANFADLILTVPTISKTGYTCKWNTKSDGSGTDYASGANYTFAGNGTTASLTLYAVCTANTYIVTYDYQENYNYPATKYMDTGYKINWDKDFKIETTINVPTLGQRYLVIGNYVSGVVTNLNIEINDSNALRVYMADAKVNKASGTITANEDIKVTYTWTASTNTYSITAKGTNTNISFSGSYDMSGTATNALRVGAADLRTGTIPFKTLTVKSLKISNPQVYGTAFSNLPTVSRLGYTFDGWYNNSSYTTKLSTSSTLTSSTATFSDINTNGSVATVYNKPLPANTYTIEYYTYDGVTKLGTSTHTYDTAKALTTMSTLGGTAPSNKVTFYGWATSANSTTRTYTNGQSVTNLTTTNGATIKLYAIWRSAAVKITYYSGINKASSGDSGNLYFYNGASGVEYTVPTPSNVTDWSTLGWRDDTTAGTSEYTSNTSYTFSASTTLRAVYSRTHKATFYSGVNKAANKEISNTAYYNTNASATPTSVTITAATAADCTDISNWTELGWRNDTTAAAKEISFGEELTLTFGTTYNYYAVYSRTLTISYNGNGATSGSVSATTKVIYLNTNSTTTSSQEVTLAANGFTKTGYTFNGWSDGSKTYAVGASYNPNLAYNHSTFTVTMSPQWGANTYALVKIPGNTNLVTNGTFESYSLANAPTGQNSAKTITHTWDLALNGVPGNTSKAYSVSNWGTGANMGVAVPEIGYHAHFRIIDDNVVLRFKTNEDYNGETGADITDGTIKSGTITTNRWLGIYHNMTASNFTAGKTYSISMDVYRVSGTSYISTGLYYVTTADTTKYGFNSGKCSLKPSTTGKWETLSCITTLSDTYSTAKAPRIYIYGYDGAPGELYVDNVKVEEVATSNSSNKVYDSTYTSTEIADLTKTGYTFNGWYNNNLYTTKLTTSHNFDVDHASFTDVNTAGTTAMIFGKWTPNTYKVEYYTYDGGTKIGTSTHTYDTAKALTTMSTLGGTAPSNKVTFFGWATSANSTTRAYTDGQSVNNLTATNGGTIKLYAIWRSAAVKITYYSGVNKASSGDSGNLYFYNGATGVEYTVPTPSNVTDWSTLGWRDDTTAGTSEYTSNTSYTFSASTTLSAVYSRTHKATFYSGVNTASNKEISNTAYYNTNTSTTPTSVTITAATAADCTDISGWTELGWRDDGTPHVQKTNFGASLTLTFGTTYNYYAVYSRSHKATFYSGVNKASNKEVSGTTYYNTNGSAIPTSVTITAATAADCTDISGWTELGWRDDGTPHVQETNFGASLTLTFGTTYNYYAVYSRSHSATFYSGVNKATTKTFSGTAYYNTNTSETPTSVTVSTSTGDCTDISNWTELGWRNDTTAGPKETDFGSTLTLTFGTTYNYYAVYSRTLTISYNSNGATSGSVADTTKVIYLNANSTTTSSQEVTLAANRFTKTGYTFNGWSDGSKTYAAGASYNPNLAYNHSTFKVTMNAQWNANTYNINYELNGGSFEISVSTPTSETDYNAPTSGTYDSTVTISNPTKIVKVTGDANSTGATVTTSPASKAQTFAGWTSTTINTSTAKYNSSSWTSWNGTTEVTSTTFKNLTPTNGATVTMVANWTPVSLTLPTVTKTGYTCNWNTKSDGSGTSYASGGSYTPSATSDAEVTLYAQCEANTYTINYFLGNGLETEGATLIGTSTCTYNASCTLTTFADLGGIFPHSTADNTTNGKAKYYWAFYGWGTTTSDTSRNHSNGKTFTYQIDRDLNLYAIGRKAFYFYSGIAPTTTASAVYQYWNPYSTAASQLSNITIGTPTDIAGWEFIGYRASNSASPTVTYAADKVGTTTKPAYSSTARTQRGIYKRDLTISYDGNGNTGGSTSNTTQTQYYNSGYASSGANIGANVSTPSFTLATNGFTKTDYEFVNWAEGSPSGTQYDAGATYTGFVPTVDSTTTTQTMYAMWGKKYTVRYVVGNTELGTSEHFAGISSPLTTFKARDYFSIITELSPNGVWGSLAGWSVNSTSTLRDYTYNGSIAYDKDITLYAVFQRTLTFYSGVNKAKTEGTEIQYWNPSGNKSSTVPTPTPTGTITNFSATKYQYTVNYGENCGLSVCVFNEYVDAASDVPININAEPYLYAYYESTKKVNVYSGPNGSKTNHSPTCVASYSSDASSVPTTCSLTLPTIDKIASLGNHTYTGWEALGFRTDTTLSSTVEKAFGVTINNYAMNDTTTSYYAIYSRTVELISGDPDVKLTTNVSGNQLYNTGNGNQELVSAIPILIQNPVSLYSYKVSNSYALIGGGHVYTQIYWKEMGYECYEEEEEVNNFLNGATVDYAANLEDAIAPWYSTGNRCYAIYRRRFQLVTGVSGSNTTSSIVYQYFSSSGGITNLYVPSGESLATMSYGWTHGYTSGGVEVKWQPNADDQTPTSFGITPPRNLGYANDTRNHDDEEFNVLASAGIPIPLYAIYGRDVTFYSGYNKATAGQVKLKQKYVSNGSLGAVTTPAKAKLTSLSSYYWNAIGYRDDTSRATFEYSFSQSVTPTVTDSTPYFYTVYSRPIKLYATSNSTAEETLTQYYNSGTTSTSSVELPYPTDITNWTALGWRTDTSDFTATYEAGNNYAPAYNSKATSLYGVYSGSLIFYHGEGSTQYVTRYRVGTTPSTVTAPESCNKDYSSYGWSCTGWRSGELAAAAFYDLGEEFTPSLTITQYSAAYERTITAYSGPHGSLTTHTATQYLNVSAYKVSTLTLPTLTAKGSFDSVAAARGDDFDTLVGWSYSGIGFSTTYGPAYNATPATLYATYQRDAIIYSGQHSDVADTVSQYYSAYNNGSYLIDFIDNRYQATIPSGYTLYGLHEEAQQPHWEDYCDINTYAEYVGSARYLYAIYQKTITGYYGLNKASSTTGTLLLHTGGDIAVKLTSVSNLTNWTFLGWRYDTTAGARHLTASSSSFNPVYNTSDNWYAVYTRQRIVAYDANGGSGGASQQSKVVYMNTNSTTTSSQTINLSTTTPSKSGSTFLGWNTNASATTASVTAGAPYTNTLAYNAASWTTTLYAIYGTVATPTSE